MNKKEDPKILEFKAKYFPESVADELTHPSVQRLFWRQIRQGIVEDSIYCPPELCVLFAAQTQQFEHGDYADGKMDGTQKELESLLPVRCVPTPAVSRQFGSATHGVKASPPSSMAPLAARVMDTARRFCGPRWSLNYDGPTRAWFVHGLTLGMCCTHPSFLQDIATTQA